MARRPASIAFLRDEKSALETARKSGRTTTSASLSSKALMLFPMMLAVCSKTVMVLSLPLESGGLVISMAKTTCAPMLRAARTGTGETSPPST